MGLFSKSKKADVPLTVQAGAGAGAKKLRLNFGGVSGETISAMSAGTLQAGGWVEAPPAEPEIGARMPDGTVLAGISPDTRKPMYVTPADAPLSYTFNEAKEYAAKLYAHGHDDWRVPTKNELNVLFNNRAAIGGFDVSGSYPAGWYWSASQYGKWTAWNQRFSDGCQGDDLEDWRSALRCVR